MRTNLNLPRKPIPARQLVALLIVAPMVAGCGGLSDFSLKDQQWFARPGRIFKGSNSTIETPPLSASKEVTPNDLISSDGQCPGGPAQSAPADANASTDGQPVQVAAPVALGHTECDVARAIPAAPDNVNLTNNTRGDRVAVITWTHGPRPGAYTFTSGRLTSIERVDAPEPEKPVRGAKKRRS